MLSLVAQHSALCPMCGVYIAKSRSRVVALPEALPIQPDRWSVERRAGWQGYRPAEDRQLRRWVHERCYADGLEVIRARLRVEPSAQPVGAGCHRRYAAAHRCGRRCANTPAAWHPRVIGALEDA